MKTTLSVAIATYNEEEFIQSCLDSVSKIAQEVVVYDAKSTDQTLTILKKNKVKIIQGDNHEIFHVNKQIAIDNCTQDWILQLDADEVVSPNLAKEIINTINSHPQHQGFWINRANYFLGRFLKKGGQYPDKTLRLYKRGKGKLPCFSVHEQAQVEGTTGFLQHDLLHYADKTFARYLLRNNRYTSLLSKELKNPGFFDYFVVKPTSWFLKTYFRHKGYQDGFPGFVFSWYSSLRFPIAYIKKREGAQNRV